MCVCVSESVCVGSEGKVPDKDVTHYRIRRLDGASVRLLQEALFEKHK